MNDVRELLGRAAEDAGQPVISTEVVYSRAARVRLRRRAAVSAAALAVVAAAVVTLPGFQDGAGTEQASVAASAEPAVRSARAQKLTGLLPPGAGTVEQVSLAVLIKHATPAQAEETYVGPLDGQYAVRRDGGVGYLTLTVRTKEQITRKLGGQALTENLCSAQGNEPPRSGCVREELPDGRVLTIWHDSMDYGDGGTPQWGPEVAGRLTLQDGGALSIRSSTGYLSDSGRSQGPLLKSPPLSREQLRTLMLRPELLPG